VELRCQHHGFRGHCLVVRAAWWADQRHLQRGAAVLPNRVRLHSAGMVGADCGRRVGWSDRSSG
jgi:hypothetical protein